MKRLACLLIAVFLPANWSTAEIITGTGAGVPGDAKVFQDGTVTRSFAPYGGFTGGVRVAAGDVSNDGLADFITGAASSAVGGHVKVFDGLTGTESRSFLAYDGFAGGVFVGAGDTNNDGFADIITGADAGAPGGHVKVFDGQTNSLLRSFFAFDGFSGGVRVAAGDINNDGVADIVTGAGAGAPGGHVKVFDGGNGALLRSFFAYDGFTGGVYVASGDINGDGFDDIISGADDGAPGGHVKVFDGQSNSLLRSFFAYDGFSGGVRVAAADLDGDGLGEIITAAGSGAPGGHVKVFDGATGALDSSFFAYAPAFTGGAYVAAAPIPEPGSLALALLGIAVWLCARNRHSPLAHRETNGRTNLQRHHQVS
jgi:hypothetical protein